MIDLKRIKLCQVVSSCVQLCPESEDTRSRSEANSETVLEDVASSAAHPHRPLLAWINHLGAATVARSVVCAEFTVRNWKRGRPISLKHSPELICNSRRQPLPDGTALTYEDCLGLVSEERFECRKRK